MRSWIHSFIDKIPRDSAIVISKRDNRRVKHWTQVNLCHFSVLSLTMVWYSRLIVYVCTDGQQESPHEHQQTLLLSRIITNVVCKYVISHEAYGYWHLIQEKLNEAVMVLNKSLQVRQSWSLVVFEFDQCTGDQRPKHECRIGRADVQELPIKRSFPSRGYVVRMQDVPHANQDYYSYRQLEGPSVICLFAAFGALEYAQYYVFSWKDRRWKRNRYPNHWSVLASECSYIEHMYSNRQETDAPYKYLMWGGLRERLAQACASLKAPALRIQYNTLPAKA